MPTLDTRYIPGYVTTPAGTVSSAPLVTAVDLGQSQLLEVRLTIPGGHAGATGWRLDYAGTTILPFSNPSQWFINDGVDLAFDLDIQVGRGLQIVTYNADVYPHTHYATFKVADIPSAPDRPLTLVDIDPL